METTTNAEHDLLVRLAWLYYVAGQNHEEIARQIGHSRSKITRMLARARERGIVKISIDHHSTETLELGAELADRFGLVECIVTPPLHPSVALGEEEAEANARRAVGIAGADFLARQLQGGELMTVGLSWGRTIAALVEAFPILSRPDARFVSLMGSLSRTARTNPFEVVSALAQACGGEAYVLPAPFIADSEADFRVLMGQKLVRESLALGAQADFCIASFGVCSRDSFIYRHGLIREEEMDELLRAGAVGDMLGKFFDAEGRLVASGLNERTPSISIDDLRSRELVLLAAGTSKLAALTAILRTGLVRRLIVDGDLARAVLAD